MHWVSFICINQDDLDERMQQVEVVYRIFSKADKVIAYLGDEADGCEHLPELLGRTNAFHSKDSRDKGDTKSLFKKHCVEDDWVRLRLPESDNDAWTSLEKSISRLWFVRMWILPETSSAISLRFILNKFLNR